MAKCVFAGMNSGIHEVEPMILVNMGVNRLEWQAALT